MSLGASIATWIRGGYGNDDNAVARVGPIPAVVETKLGRLGDLASAAHGALTRLLEEEREARTALREATARVEMWNGTSASKRDPALGPTLEAAVATCTRSVDRVAARLPDLQGRFDASGRLLERCREFVRTSAPSALTAAVADAQKELSSFKVPNQPDLPGALATTRETLQTLANDRRAVELAGVPLAEAKERAVATLEALARDWDPPVGHFFASGGFHPDMTGIIPCGEHLDQRAFFASLLGDGLKARLFGLLEREAARRDLLLPAPERERRLVDLDAKARTVRLREELLIMALEASGLSVLRREDADPRCVLAVAEV